MPNERSVHQQCHISGVNAYVMVTILFDEKTRGAADTRPLQRLALLVVSNPSQSIFKNSALVRDKIVGPLEMLRATDRCLSRS
jgi:hypothetical protein